MRRIFVALFMLAVVGLIGYFLGKPGVVPADPKPEPGPAAAPMRIAKTPEAKPAAEHLPVKRIILFSNGVAYVQREGHVDGNARVDLSFPQQNINDLLKSMVLEDLGGGTISTVSFDSHDPIAKTLKSFAVDLNGNPSLGQILLQARGEKVEVVTRQSSTTFTGSVIGIEHPLDMGPTCTRTPAFALPSVGVTAQTKHVVARVPLEESKLQSALLNLRCEDGIRAIALSDVQRLRFVNPALDADFQRALEVLAMSHDTQKKAVSLNFSGQGKRQVRVGYVVENPLWRTSYRLMVGKDDKLFLQGWAVVENPSNEDWKDVGLTLVSGQPISFQMDLYQPLYASRPVVQPELHGNVRPVVYGGSMDAQNENLAKVAGDRIDAIKAAERQWDRNRGANQEMFLKELNMGRGPYVNPQLALPMAAPSSATSPPANQNQVMQINPRNVVAAATAIDKGDFFQYVIKHAVTLPRQKSAMLPIVNKEIEGAKVSIYNDAAHAKYPFFGLQLKNTTGLHLSQGPVAVFDGASYAGDAQLLDLQPREDRLISYAVDVGMEVEPIAKHRPARLMSIKIHKGLFHATSKVRETKTYNVKNRSAHDRTLLIEHPYRPDYKIVSKAQPKERSRDMHRFEVKVAAGKTASLEVVEEQDVVNQVGLTNAPDQLIVHLIKHVESNEAKEMFAKAIQLREKLSAVQAEVARAQQQLQDITSDQARLRANLKDMPQTAAAYKRYLEKFDSQETEIEKLQAQIKKVRESEATAQQELHQYLMNLNLDSTPVGGSEGIVLPDPGQNVRHVAPMPSPLVTTNSSPAANLAPEKLGLDPSELAWRTLGVKLRPVAKEIVTRVNNQLQGGLEVVEVRAGSPAEKAGLRQSDILVGLHHWETLKVENVAYVLSHPELAKLFPMSFYIVRGGEVRRGAVER